MPELERRFVEDEGFFHKLSELVEANRSGLRVASSLGLEQHHSVRQLWGATPTSEMGL
jgi:hypothetical protein